MPHRLLTFPAEQLGTFVSEAWSAFRGASRYREVPPLDLRLSLLGQALLDRSFTLATSMAIGVPLPGQVRGMVEEAKAMREFFEEMGWIDNPAAYHQTPPPIGDFELTPASTWGGMRRWRYQELSFESEFQPHVGEPGREAWMAHEKNGRVAAYILEHEGPPRPWIVGLHGFAMGTPLVSFTGFPVKMLHETLGLNVALPVMPLHASRGSARFSGREVLEANYVQMIHLFSQGTWDTRRILSWIRSRGGERIGLYGISMGGYISSLTAALEDGLEAIVTSIPMVDFPTAAQDNMPWIMQRYDDQFDLDWEIIRAISHVVSPLTFHPRLPKARRFIFAGIADRVVRPDQPRALWRHWGEPEIEWFSGGHVLGVFERTLEPFLENALRQ
ncbi:MAG: hypothetical protein GY723_06600, partial [bacterium]|nr:hypothetical protein [bacterium]